MNNATINPFLGFSTTAEVLIQSGADVNSVGQGGVTPLYWAAQKGKNLFLAEVLRGVICYVLDLLYIHNVIKMHLRKNMMILNLV